MKLQLIQLLIAIGPRSVVISQFFICKQEVYAGHGGCNNVTSEGNYRYNLLPVIICGAVIGVSALHKWGILINGG